MPFACYFINTCNFTSNSAQAQLAMEPFLSPSSRISVNIKTMPALALGPGSEITLDKSKIILPLKQFS
jgi:hypothetical protein